jgi:hypothetical protein
MPNALPAPGAEDPFTLLEPDTAAEQDFTRLMQRPSAGTAHPSPLLPGAAGTGTFLGFDLQDRPLVGGLAGCPGRVIEARSTVALRRDMVGMTVVTLFEQGDPGLPIIMGVLQPTGTAAPEPAPLPQVVSAQVDGDRLVLTAEREVVLRCGDASITLTRAGKVLIKGHYVLSRSTGYNKIKGASIDIN